jgi:NADH:ubiquinone oxidoreductase subunit C
MTIDETLDSLKNKFGGNVLKVEKTVPNRAYVDIDPKDAVPFVKYLFKDLKLRLNTISGVDSFDGIEMLYHLTSDKNNFIITVRALIKDKANPHIDTITSFTKSGWWIEREVHELFGVTFDNNSDLRTLLLPDDWPEGVFPMRKDFLPPKRDSRGHVHKPGA